MSLSFQLIQITKHTAIRILVQMIMESDNKNMFDTSDNNNTHTKPAHNLTTVKTTMV